MLFSFLYIFLSSISSPGLLRSFVAVVTSCAIAAMPEAAGEHEDKSNQEDSKINNSANFSFNALL